jgi:hypothetical protein
LVYVYAAVSGDVPDGALSGLTPMPGGGPVRSLHVDEDLTLVVSDVPEDRFNEAAIEQRLRDLDWVSAAGVAHHAVIEALAESQVLLPFRLFTIFSSDDKAIATINAARAPIRNAFDRVRGRQEWVLRIGRPDPARAEGAQAAAAGRATSGTGFLQAKADARRAEADRAARVSRGVSDVFDALKPLASAASSRPVQAGEGVLLDAAFLIDAGRLDEFRGTLQQAAAGLLRDGCPISFTGPWPPYSFASLDTNAHA